MTNNDSKNQRPQVYQRNDEFLLTSSTNHLTQDKDSINHQQNDNQKAIDSQQSGRKIINLFVAIVIIVD